MNVVGVQAYLSFDWSAMQLVHTSILLADLSSDILIFNNVA